jgi:CheY-like chemotaxis protein
MRHDTRRAQAFGAAARTPKKERSPSTARTVMSPNVLDSLFASPLAAVGLVAGGLVLVALVARTLRRRRHRAPDETPAARPAGGDGRTGAETAPAPSASPPVSTRAPRRESLLPAANPRTTAQAASPLADPPTSPAADPAPGVIARSADTSRQEPAPDEMAPGARGAPIAEPGTDSVLPASQPPADDIAAPRWFDAIPTPDVVEVSTPATGPEAVTFATFGLQAPEMQAPGGEAPAAPVTEPSAPAGAAPVSEAPFDETPVVSSSVGMPAADTTPPAPLLLLDEPLQSPAYAEPPIAEVAAPGLESPALDAPAPVADAAPVEPTEAVATTVAPSAPVPAVAPEAVAEWPPSAAPTPAAEATPGRLLVVDDSAVVRAKLRKLLEGGGHKVDVARDGREALALLAAGRYALMVTDLEMPTMSGFELIAAVRGSVGLTALPIVAITGHDDLEPYRQRLPGLAGLFRKPWPDDALLAHLATVLAERGSASLATASAPAPQAVAVG